MPHLLAGFLDLMQLPQEKNDHMLSLSIFCMQASFGPRTSTSSIADVKLEGGSGLVICVWKGGRRPWTSCNGLYDLQGRSDSRRSIMDIMLRNCKPGMFSWLYYLKQYGFL